MRAYVQHLIGVAGAIEMRVLGLRRILAIGTFNQPDAVISAVMDRGYGEWNYYTTFNPVVIESPTNKLHSPGVGGGVKDQDISSIAFLVFDFDPKGDRPKGAASTEAESLLARERMHVFKDYMHGLGAPTPIVVFSGSGWHLYYRVDMPNNASTARLLARLYGALQERFSDDAVVFDVSVKNPSRIMKLPCTKVWYPKLSEDRPYRAARYVMPDVLMTMTMDVLAEAAVLASPSVQRSRAAQRRQAPRRGRGDYQTLDVVSFFGSKGMYQRKIDDARDAVRCPWAHEHTGESGSSDTVMMRVSGKLIFKCLHAHCVHRGLLDLAAHFDDIDQYCAREYSYASSRDRMEQKERLIAAGVPADDAGGENPAATLSVNSVADLALAESVIMKVETGGLYEYDSTVWRGIDRVRLAQLYSEHEMPHRNRANRRNEGVDYMTVKSSRRMARGAWNRVGFGEVPMLDGVLDVQTRALRPHRQQDYLDVCLPFRSCELSADMPAFERCLSDWFSDDPDFTQKLDMLQEFFGQCLLPHNAFKKALVMYGESDTGKSQLAHALEAMVGPENVSHVSPKDMGDPRQCSALVGKLVNTVSDLGRQERIDDGGFKRLTGGDEVMIDPKYIPPYSYLPIATHVIATNNLPKVDDRTNAVFRRLIILKFTRAIPRDRQDKLMGRRIASEASAILNWAIEGAKRLISVGDYTWLPSSEDAVRSYKYEQNDGLSFIADEMVEGDAPWALLSEFKTRMSLAGMRVGPRTARDYVRTAGYEIEMILGREVIKGLKWRSSLGY